MLLAGLGAGAVGVAASAAPVLSLRLAPSPSAQPASWWDRTFLSLQAAGLAEWKSVIGQTFSLSSANGFHMLKVVAVTAFPVSGSRPRTLGRSQAFSVVFEAQGGTRLPAGDRQYQLTHSTFPPMPIYMGAPAALGLKNRLIAVFN
ncbi:MAG: hypothetical protein ABWX67_03025 [Allosphingosinicella sp.]